MFILTVRNDRLGDLILALPTLTALRKNLPDARLAVVASGYAAPVLSLYEENVEVWLDSPDALGRLAADRPDAVLFLYPDRRWAIEAHRARVPERIGTRYRWHSWRFNRRVAVHRRYNDHHEAEYNLMVARPLLGDCKLTPPALHVDAELRQKAQSLLTRHGLPPGARYAVLHPGTSGSARDWPAANFTRLASFLQQSRIFVVVTGSESERMTCADIARDHAVSIAGATDIRSLAAVLYGAAVFVSCSTGPMHLAAAMGTPVVALFSANRRHSPVRWGPLGDAHTVLTPAVAPCVCKKNACLHNCMARLSPESVLTAVQSKLSIGSLV